MKSPLITVLVVAAALSGLAFTRPAAQQATLEERVQALEAQLAQQGSAEQAMAEDVEELKQLAEATVAYLEAQAKAASKMEATLAKSEDEGFTYGINPRSREILLDGWRDTLATMQTDLPGAKESKQATRSARRSR